MGFEQPGGCFTRLVGGGGNGIADVGGGEIHSGLAHHGQLEAHAAPPLVTGSARTPNRRGASRIADQTSISITG